MIKYVLLLRAPDEDGPDRYEAAFEARGYVPLSVPVLETMLVHVDTLRDKIVRGPDAQGLSGVILTSKRAVEAWCEALCSITETTLVDWRTVPFYVVGAATAAAISQIRATFPSLVCLWPANVRGGGETGTAERLAKFILAEGGGGPGRRMLYLTGDKNRETLPGILTAGGITLETLQVYRTTGSSTFRADLQAALERRVPVGKYAMDMHVFTSGLTYHLAYCADRMRRGQVWGWVVHFAPSAAAFVRLTLDEAFCVDIDGREQRTLKIAAIGPTTASYLSEELRVRVDVISPKPTPDALCSAIVAFDDVC